MFPEDVFPLNRWPHLRKDVVGKAKNKVTFRSLSAKVYIPILGKIVFFH